MTWISGDVACCKDCICSSWYSFEKWYISSQGFEYCTNYSVGFPTSMVCTSTGKIPDTVSDLSLLLLIFFIGRYYCYLPTCIIYINLKKKVWYRPILNQYRLVFTGSSLPKNMTYKYLNCISTSLKIMQ